MKLQINLGVSKLSQHIADKQWDSVLEILRANPSAATRWSRRDDFYGRIDKPSNILPIHQVCSDSSTPQNVVKALIDSYPAGLEKKESAFQRLPLHIACRNNANTDIVGLLTESYGKAAVAADQLGRYPIHYGLANSISDSVIELLLQREPNCAKGQDGRGWTALHVACAHGSSTHIIKSLLYLYPESIVETTDQGSTAVACASSPKVKAPNKDQVLSLLYDASKNYAMKLYVEKMESKRQFDRQSSDKKLMKQSSLNSFSFQSEEKSADSYNDRYGTSVKDDMKRNTYFIKSISSRSLPCPNEICTKVENASCSSLRENVATIVKDCRAFRQLQNDLRNKRTYSCIGTAESMKKYIDTRAQEVNDRMSLLSNDNVKSLIMGGLWVESNKDGIIEKNVKIPANKLSYNYLVKALQNALDSNSNNNSDNNCDYIGSDDKQPSLSLKGNHKSSSNINMKDNGEIRKESHSSYPSTAEENKRRDMKMPSIDYAKTA